MTETKVLGTRCLLAAVAGVVIALGGAAVAEDAAKPEIKWEPAENFALELKWMRPTLPDKWYTKTEKMLNKEVFLDQIVRADGPSAEPDVEISLYAFSASEKGFYNNFPEQSDEDLKKIIGSDPVLKEHKEFAEQMALRFQPAEGTQVDQGAILNDLEGFRKNRENKIKKFGPKLEEVMQLHGKGKYLNRVELSPGSAGSVASYYQAACRGEMGATCKTGKISKRKVGDMNADFFQANGRHASYGKKVTLEYYVIGSVNKHTLVIKILYMGGMEADKEIQAVVAKFLTTVKEK